MIVLICYYVNMAVILNFLCCAKYYYIGLMLFSVTIDLLM